MARSFQNKRILFLKVLFILGMNVNLNMAHNCEVTYGADMMANCSARGLKFIPYDLQHNIASLDLQHNNLGIIEENAFVKYDQLYSLNLENNSITEVKDNAFQLLRRLKYLNLSRNKLKTVPSGAFSDLPSLHLLNLRGNMISSINDNAFVKLHSLKELNLDGNYIENIAPDAFKGLNFLQVMDLQNNALRTLTEGVVQHLTHRMKAWRLYNNPWYCDCKIGWLYSYLTTSKKEFNLSWKFNQGEPKCQGPPLVKEKFFSQLNQSYFVCQIVMYSSGHQKNTKLGENVNLFCKYFSKPFIQPLWFKNEEQIEPIEGRVSILTTGKETYTSTLSIKDFQYSDIGDYKCHLENARGSKVISYSLLIPGVDPENLPTTTEISSLQPLAISESQSSDHGLDKKTIIIIASVVSGFIFACIIVGLLIFVCVRVKRSKRLRKEERSLTFKEHLKTTILNESTIRESKSDLKLETTLEEIPIEKEPLQTEEVEEQNGINTYVSFKAGYNENEDQFYSSTNTNRTKESDSSNCESTSPLLENFSPIRSDSYDPLFESTPHSFYNMPKASTLNSRYLNSDSSYDTYLSYTPCSTLSHTGPYSLPPHGHIAGTLPSKRTSVSAGYLNSLPPKKPPRLFHSRDNMSLTSQNSQTSDYGEQKLKLSLPRPGTVDSYGTAV
ncbi:leucine-rich repeat-containing protein 24-like [Saccostrea cucullata]|uniref:leucine-rich repeat-containing protein 24-like n=1 Tax=Saccostrea cuccullata TaxID=36930 RepID=UPI002ED5291B